MAREIPPGASGLLSYFTRHRTLANLLLVVMLVAGIGAVPNLRTQFFPDVIVDNVSVRAEWEGAGAEDVDQGIIQVLEPRLLVVEGVEEAKSTAREGSANIVLEFEPGWNMARAADDVQAAVDLVTTLPEEIDDPRVRRGAWRDRVTDVVITGPATPEQLGLFADELVRRLFEEGVTRTSIRGVAAPLTLVEVRSVNLIAYDISMGEIASAIAAEVRGDPAGDLTGANARVRTGTEKRTAEEIEQIVLRSNPDGSNVTIGDVAEVIRKGSDRDRAYFVSDHPAVSIRVDRSGQGDAIAVQETVEDVVASLSGTLPPEVTVELIRTRAEAITGRLNILIDNGLMGLGLVICLLFLFLNARTAFWVAAGIPVAMMAAIALMYLGGLTINMISLFGLIITLGIVVDDAIVIGEHADHRHRTLGEAPYVAAENAANRMAMPVFAATLTTVIAFFGLIAVGGRFGDLIRDIPFTVIAVLIASLVECFLILPHHMAHALSASMSHRFSYRKLAFAFIAINLIAAAAAIIFWYLVLGQPFETLLNLHTLGIGLTGAAILSGLGLLVPRRMRARWIRVMGEEGLDTPSLVVNRGFEWVRENLFRPFMAGVIVARYAVIAGVILVLAIQISAFIREDIKWRFFNAPERGSITGNFAMAEGANRADATAMMREMQRATEALGAEYEETYGMNPVAYVVAEVGGNAGRGLSGVASKDPDLLGGLSIELIDADLRSYSSFAFVADLQERVVRHPLVEILSYRSWRSGPGDAALAVDFYGADSPTLKAASEDLQKALAQFPEVSAVEDDLAYDKQELILSLTPQGQALGFSTDMLSRSLRHRVNGIEAATYPEGARIAAIRVELPEDELTADFLERMQLRSPNGVYVPLADIVSVEQRVGFSVVLRENGIRQISVTGDIAEDDPALATEITRLLETEILPAIASERKVDWNLSGLSEQEDRFLNEALVGFLLCLTGIYIVLAWIFSSWSRPLVVMAVIPFGLVGTIYGHNLMDVPLSMFTVIGLLGMTGIIINDSIVLVTTIDEHAKTRGLFPSIIDGAADRLRPVMLTTLTTVLGMAPLLYEQSQQAQFLKPTVITLVYGLGFGMIMVLLIVPALVAVQQDVGQQFRAMRRGARARALALRITLAVLCASILAWAAATLGAVIIWGSLPALLSDLVPAAPITAALFLFVVGTASAALLTYILGALFFALSSRHARTA
ncbi:MAG: efflux RND transporter permease subunit [Paracoccaceae bacterium]